MTFLPTSVTPESSPQHADLPPLKKASSSFIGNKRRTDIKYETIYVTRDFEPDPSLKAHTDHYLDLFQKSMELVKVML